MITCTITSCGAEILTQNRQGKTVPYKSPGKMVICSRCFQKVLSLGIPIPWEQYEIKKPEVFKSRKVITCP